MKTSSLLARVLCLAPLAFAAHVAFAGCSSSSSSSSSGGSDAAPDVFSKCGKSGDTGNAFGVGKYCTNFHDCADNTQAHICSVIGDLQTHFCTMTCTPPDAGGDADPDASGQPTMDCGANATCECGGGGCGCTPNACLGP